MGGEFLELYTIVQDLWFQMWWGIFSGIMAGAFIIIHNENKEKKQLEENRRWFLKHNYPDLFK